MQKYFLIISSLINEAEKLKHARPFTMEYTWIKYLIVVQKYFCRIPQILFISNNDLVLICTQ